MPVIITVCELTGSSPPRGITPDGRPFSVNRASSPGRFRRNHPARRTPGGYRRPATVDVMDKKLLGLLVGAAVGWLVKQAVAEALEDAGIPLHVATVAGAIAGALVS